KKPRRDDEPPQSLADFVEDQLPDDPQDDPDSDEQVPLPDPDADLGPGDPQDEGSSVPVGGTSLGLLLLTLLSQAVPLLKMGRRAVRRRRPRPSARVVGAWR